MIHVRTFGGLSALALAGVLVLGHEAAQAQVSGGTAVAPRAAVAPAPAVNAGGYYASVPATGSVNRTPTMGATRGTYYGSSANLSKRNHVGGLNHDYSKGWYFSPLAKPWLKPLR